MLNGNVEAQDGFEIGHDRKQHGGRRCQGQKDRRRLCVLCWVGAQASPAWRRDAEAGSQGGSLAAPRGEGNMPDIAQAGQSSETRW